MSRVKSVSSPRLILTFLAISMGIAAASIPFWDTVVVLGAGTWIGSLDQVRPDCSGYLLASSLVW